jgi:hypothetical protein
MGSCALTVLADRELLERTLPPLAPKPDYWMKAMYTTRQDKTRQDKTRQRFSFSWIKTAFMLGSGYPHCKLPCDFIHQTIICCTASLCSMISSDEYYGWWRFLFFCLLFSRGFYAVVSWFKLNGCLRVSPLLGLVCTAGRVLLMSVFENACAWVFATPVSFTMAQTHCSKVSQFIPKIKSIEIATLSRQPLTTFESTFRHLVHFI